MRLPVLFLFLGIRLSSGAEKPSERLAPPSLPDVQGSVSLEAQEWSLKPGPRSIAVHVRYPGPEGRLANVRPTTGLMLSLHNWGGSGFAGTADPDFLARTFDVVAVGVDYLQSGRKAAIDDPEPYDFGWLQALDALRALHWAFHDLERRGIPFDRTRLYATGGSGGGNVTLMANKLAPRTFAAAIDLCGMKKLSDDIAFGLPGGSELDARYVRDPNHRFYLPPDAQEIRFTSHPNHLATMKTLGCRARIVTVHGVDDRTCPDVEEYATNMLRSGLDFLHVPVTRDALDGEVFTSSAHALGDRTRIVERVAGRFLNPASPECARLEGPTDFERKEAIRYATSHGTWVVDYRRGFPVGYFEPNPPSNP
ncbi:MAG: hypothetical protein JNL97_11250 [Verrucomicrobiales bacterium]|nr:hypothetical protein [Verrucomicrobiales bacterium]